MEGRPGSTRRRRLDRGIKARTDTIYAIAAPADLAYVLAPRLLPAGLLLILPLLLPGYYGKVLVYACIYGLLALSWDLLASCGLFSLGQALFLGVGAYIAGSLNYYLGLPMLVTIPVATLLGGAICAALLSPVIRLKGVYFAIVSLMLPILLKECIQTTGILGGTHGLGPITAFPHELLAKYLLLAAFLGCLFGLRVMINTDYGLVLRAIRDDDRAVMSAGINIYWRKVQALFLGGAIGSFAGAFLTHYFQFVGYSGFALDYSILPVAAAALGGPGTFAGAALGSMLLVPLSEALRELGGLRIAIYCAILIVSIVALPEGVFRFLERKYQQFETTQEVG